MKKAIWICISVLLFSLWVVWTLNKDTKKTEATADKIDNVGNAASTLGYDGDKIKEELRGLQDLKKRQDKNMEELMGE